MVKLPSVLIHPRPIRRDRTLATGLGLIGAIGMLWMLLSVALRAFGS